MSENKFTLETKRKLAQRAGYMCSLCGKLTIGPSSESDESVTLLGDAAHIASAETKGRRHDERMLSKDRKDINNGIWLCKNHHKLVDSDETEYSTAFLHTIKKNHEVKIDLLNSGLNLDNGLVVKVEIENLADIRKKQEIEFSNFWRQWNRKDSNL
jgi:predicted restriction endonuclease